MDPAHWRRVKSVFAEAIEHDGDARRAFLNATFRDQPALRSDVENLLAGHDFAQHFLSAPAMARPTSTDEPAIGDGQRLGPYRIVSQLGRGGMGAVYLAARDDGVFDKQVAIKVIKRGMDTDEIIRRFQNERRILASLEHPNIAQLLDGGTTADGLPYFVMEHVEGTPIDRYCAEHDLDTDSRLRLFREVCSAVQIAHQRLVVHRDLKPGNILVTANGVPKLLDFGIAKLLSGEVGPEAPLETLAAERMMTPAYASPEQVRGETITTASDVYSLGVLLYRLLARRLPYRVVPSEPAQMVDAIVHNVPPRPSSTVAREGTSTDDAPAAGSFAARRLRRRLRGDLDTIVLCALAKEPTRRYASVERFSADIARHLDGLPIEARAPTLGYRLGKFVRRNKTGSALLAAIVLFAIGMTLSRIEVAAERDRADRGWTRAERMVGFIMDVFQTADPISAQGEELTARDILEAGAERIPELGDDPPLQASMLDFVGNILRRLDEPDAASPLLEQALALRRAHAEVTPAEVATTLGHLGLLATEQGRTEEALAYHEEALALRRSHLVDHADIAESLNYLAVIYRDTGRLPEAREALTEALAIQRRHLGTEDDQFAATLNALATVLVQSGDPNAAMPIYEEAVEVYAQTLGDEHTYYLTALVNLAMLHNHMGDHAAAEPLVRTALETFRTVFGPDHVRVHAIALRLGSVLYQAGDYPGAKVALDEVVAAMLRSLPEDHQLVLTARNIQARCDALLGDLDGAERSYRNQLATHEQLDPQIPSLMAQVTANLGWALVQQGQLDEAEGHLSRALTTQREVLGPEHDNVGSTLNALGLLALARNRPADATRHFTAAHDILARALGDDHPKVATSLLGLGRAATLEDRPQDASRAFGRALAIRAAAYGADHPITAEARAIQDTTTNTGPRIASNNGG